MKENLNEIIGFIILGILGVIVIELIKIKFEDYISFLVTGSLYMVYKIYDECR